VSSLCQKVWTAACIIICAAAQRGLAVSRSWTVTYSILSYGQITNCCFYHLLLTPTTWTKSKMQVHIVGVRSSQEQRNMVVVQVNKRGDTNRENEKAGYNLFQCSFLVTSPGGPLSLRSLQMRTPDTAAPGPMMTVAIKFHNTIKAICLELLANQRVPNKLEPKVNTASHCKYICVYSRRLMVVGSGGRLVARRDR
jgi:hypothetical protein